MTKKKIIILTIIISLFVVLLVGGTYAWYVWSTSSDDEVQVLAGLDAATVIYTGGSNITGARLKPTATKEEGIVKSIKVYAKDDVYYTLKFDLYLDILSLPERLKDVSFKYGFYKGDTLVKEGSFTQSYLNSNLVGCTTNNTNHIVLLDDENITSNRTEYILYIWIDGNLPNPNTMQNLDFSFKLHASGENAVVEEKTTLVEHISNLYNDAEKTTITNNSIKYFQAKIYDTDTDDTTKGGLMNDRLGGTTSDYNAGNIRYYGANPSNYIDIGDRDASGNVIPWRIIGVFKNMTLADGSTDTLVKVIRDQSLSSDMLWDGDDRFNDWHNATLQTYLNTGEYYTGLSQSVKDKIAKVEWNLGGWDNSAVYPNLIYEKERGNAKCDDCTYNTIWEGDIALMYPSDYGYAADLTSCSKDLLYYDEDTTNCTGTDWLFNSKYQWVLTPTSSYARSAWYVESSGYVYFDYAVYNSRGVRPVLYLKSELVIETGDGSTIANAYVVR